MDMQKQYSLLTLLPYKADVQILDKLLRDRIVQLLIWLMGETIRTLDDFTKTTQSTAFDPHVGENLCQIRAALLLSLMDEYASDDNFKMTCITLRQQFTTLLNELSILTTTPEIEVLTLQNFLESKNLLLGIDSRIFTLVLMHFLTTFRIFDNAENSVIDYAKMTGTLSVSKNLCRRFIHHYQKLLSQISSQFLFKLAAPFGATWIKILQALSHEDEDARTTLPCYLVMKVLFHYLQQQKINILFVVRQQQSTQLINLFYKYESQKNHYVLKTKLNDTDLNSHSLVIHGISHRKGPLTAKYQEQFENIGMFNILMANMAAHPQYSGRKLSHLKENPFRILKADEDQAMSLLINEVETEFLEMKCLSDKHGCNEFQHDMLFIRHIFCDTVKNQLSCVNKQLFYREQAKNNLSLEENWMPQFA